MEYRNLEGITADTIVPVFNRAFSDYQVPMTMTPGDLASMMAGRGYCGAVSVGAFDSENLVGFILNGLRDRHGSLTFYDIGTGIVPEYQGRGIATSMIAYAKELMDRIGAGCYLLEVLQENASAVKLYQRNQFVIVRELICYRMNRPEGEPDENAGLCGGETLEPFFRESGAAVTAMWDVCPSWQHSAESIVAGAGEYAWKAVYDSQGLAGYGVINMLSGRLAQLAVRPDVRRQGLGRRLLRDLSAAADDRQISAVNVDSNGRNVIPFLICQGFEEYVRQYEMEYRKQP